MSEIPELPLRQESPRQQLVEISAIVQSALQINDLKIGQGGAKLVEDPDAEEFSIDEIRAQTPVVYIKSNGNEESHSLDGAVRGLLPVLAKKVLSEAELAPFLDSNGEVPEGITSLKALHAILAKAPSAEFARALEDLGVHKLPPPGSGKLPDSKWDVAAVQVAILEEAIDLTLRLSHRRTEPDTLSGKNSGHAVDQHRGEVYTTMRTTEDSTELTGGYRVTVDRNIKFKVGEKQVDIPVSSIFLTLKSTLDRRGKNQEQIAMETGIGMKVAELLKGQFADVPDVGKFVDVYVRYLADPNSLSDDEDEYLHVQADYRNFRAKKSGDHFLTSAFDSENHKADFDTPKVDVTVKEDLMAAQQILNSLAPPEYLAEMTKLEKEYDELSKDKTTNAQKISDKFDQIAKRRQRLYRAVMCAENVRPENLSSYGWLRQSEDPRYEYDIDYTEEEKILAEQIKAREYQRVQYIDYTGQERKTVRSEMNAIDANRLAMIDTIGALGVDISKVDWKVLNAKRQEIVSKIDLNDINGVDRNESLRLFGNEVIRMLGLGDTEPNHQIAKQVIRDRLATDFRLLGGEDKFASRFPDLPKNLVLTIRKDMGLKGVELLYRRSVTSGQESTDDPEIDRETVEKLANTKIRLMKQEQGDDIEGVLDRLNSLSEAAATVGDPKVDPVAPPPNSNEESAPPADSVTIDYAKIPISTSREKVNQRLNEGKEGATYRPAGKKLYLYRDRPADVIAQVVDRSIQPAETDIADFTKVTISTDPAQKSEQLNGGKVAVPFKLRAGKEQGVYLVVDPKDPNSLIMVHSIRDLPPNSQALHVTTENGGLYLDGQQIEKAISKSNPELLDIPGLEGHRVAILGFDPQTRNLVLYKDKKSQATAVVAEAIAAIPDAPPPELQVSPEEWADFQNLRAEYYKVAKELKEKDDPETGEERLKLARENYRNGQKKIIDQWLEKKNDEKVDMLNNARTIHDQISKSHSDDFGYKVMEVFSNVLDENLHFDPNKAIANLLTFDHLIADANTHRDPPLASDVKLRRDQLSEFYNQYVEVLQRVTDRRIVDHTDLSGRTVFQVGQAFKENLRAVVSDVLTHPIDSKITRVRKIGHISLSQEPAIQELEPPVSAEVDSWISDATPPPAELFNDTLKTQAIERIGADLSDSEVQKSLQEQYFNYRDPKLKKDLEEIRLDHQILPESEFIVKHMGGTGKMSDLKLDGNEISPAQVLPFIQSTFIQDTLSTQFLANIPQESNTSFTRAKGFVDLVLENRNNEIYKLITASRGVLRTGSHEEKGKLWTEKIVPFLEANSSTYSLSDFEKDQPIWRQVQDGINEAVAAHSVQFNGLVEKWERERAVVTPQPPVAPPTPIATQTAHSAQQSAVTAEILAGTNWRVIRQVRPNIESKSTSKWGDGGPILVTGDEEVTIEGDQFTKLDVSGKAKARVSNTLSKDLVISENGNLFVNVVFGGKITVQDKATFSTSSLMADFHIYGDGVLVGCNSVTKLKGTINSKEAILVLPKSIAIGEIVYKDGGSIQNIYQTESDYYNNLVNKSNGALKVDTLSPEVGEKIDDKSFYLYAKNNVGKIIRVTYESQQTHVDSNRKPVWSAVMTKVEEMSNEAPSTVVAPPTTSPPAPTPPPQAPPVAEAETLARANWKVIREVKPNPNPRESVWSDGRDIQVDGERNVRIEGGGFNKLEVTEKAKVISSGMSNKDITISDSGSLHLVSVLGGTIKVRDNATFSISGLLSDFEIYGDGVLVANGGVEAPKGTINSNGAILVIPKTEDISQITFTDGGSIQNIYQTGIEYKSFNFVNVSDGALNVDTVSPEAGGKIDDRSFFLYAKNVDGRIIRVTFESQLTHKHYKSGENQWSAVMTKVEEMADEVQSAVVAPRAQARIGNREIRQYDGSDLTRLATNSDILIFKNQHQFQLGENTGSVGLSDNVKGVILENKDTIHLQDNALGTVIKDEGNAIKIDGDSCVYVDSMSTKSMLEIDSLDAIVIVPSGTKCNVDSALLTKDSELNIQDIFNQTVFVLPKGISSINDFIKSGTIDLPSMFQAGGMVTGKNDKRFVLKATNRKGHEIKVTFELQQGLGPDGKDSPTLVMTHVAGPDSRSVPSPQAPVPPDTTAPVIPPAPAPRSTPPPPTPVPVTFAELALSSNPEYTTIKSKNWGGVLVPVGGERSVDTTKKAQNILQSLASGKDFEYLGQSGKKQIFKASDLNFDGKSTTDNQVNLRKLIEVLNQNISYKGMGPGEEVKFAFGNIYHDSQGRTSFTYANVGDCEIAIVRVDGTVKLLHNDSQRSQEETHEYVNEYLARRGIYKSLSLPKENLGIPANSARLEKAVGTVYLSPGDRVIFLTPDVGENLANTRSPLIQSRSTLSFSAPNKEMGIPLIGLDVLGMVSENAKQIADFPDHVLAMLKQVQKLAPEEGFYTAREAYMDEHKIPSQHDYPRRMVRIPNGKGGNYDIIYGGPTRPHQIPSVVAIELGPDGKTITTANATFRSPPPPSPLSELDTPPETRWTVVNEAPRYLGTPEHVKTNASDFEIADSTSISLEADYAKSIVARGSARVGQYYSSSLTQFWATEKSQIIVVGLFGKINSSGNSTNHISLLSDNGSFEVGDDSALFIGANKSHQESKITSPNAKLITTNLPIMENYQFEGGASADKNIFRLDNNISGFHFVDPKSGIVDTKRLEIKGGEMQSEDSFSFIAKNEAGKRVRVTFQPQKIEKSDDKTGSNWHAVMTKVEEMSNEAPSTVVAPPPTTLTAPTPPTPPPPTHVLRDNQLAKAPNVDIPRNDERDSAGRSVRPNTSQNGEQIRIQINELGRFGVNQPTGKISGSSISHFGDSRGIIRENRGYIWGDTRSIFSVGKNTGNIVAHNNPEIFVEDSKGGKVTVRSPYAIIVSTYSGIQRSTIKLELPENTGPRAEDYNPKTAFERILYKLPKNITSLSVFIDQGGKLNQEAILSAGGVVTTENTVRFTATNKKHQSRTVTFELQDVPTGNPSNPDEVSPMLVMVKSEEAESVVKVATEMTAEAKESQIIAGENFGGLLSPGIGASSKKASSEVQQVITSLLEGVDIPYSEGNYTFKAEQLEFEGKSIAHVEKTIKKMVSILNSQVGQYFTEGVKGEGLGISLGTMYENDKGENVFTYVNYSDSKIAVIDRLGKVRLINEKNGNSQDEKDYLTTMLSCRGVPQRNYLLSGASTWNFDNYLANRTDTIKVADGDRVVFLSQELAENLTNLRRSIKDGKVEISAVPQKEGDPILGLDILGTLAVEPNLARIPNAILSTATTISDAGQTGSENAVRLQTIDQEATQGILGEKNAYDIFAFPYPTPSGETLNMIRGRSPINSNQTSSVVVMEPDRINDGVNIVFGTQKSHQINITDSSIGAPTPQPPPDSRKETISPPVAAAESEATAPVVERTAESVRQNLLSTRQAWLEAVEETEDMAPTREAYRKAQAQAMNFWLTTNIDALEKALSVDRVNEVARNNLRSTLDKIKSETSTIEAIYSPEIHNEAIAFVQAVYDMTSPQEQIYPTLIEFKNNLTEQIENVADGKMADHRLANDSYSSLENFKYIFAPAEGSPDPKNDPDNYIALLDNKTKIGFTPKNILDSKYQVGAKFTFGRSTIPAPAPFRPPSPPPPLPDPAGTPVESLAALNIPLENIDAGQTVRLTGSDVGNYGTIAGTLVTSGSSLASASVVSGIVTTTQDSSAKIGILKKPSGEEANQEDGYIGFGQSKGTLRTNEGRAIFEDSTLGTIGINKNEATLNRNASVYIDSQSVDNTAYVLVNGLQTHLVTPKGFGIVWMGIDFRNDLEGALRSVHYTLPDTVTSLASFMVKGQLDNDRLASAGGTINEDKTYTFIATNGNGNQIKVTYELQDVPTGNEINLAEVAPMLVMVKVEDVAVTEATDSATPTEAQRVKLNLESSRTSYFAELDKSPANNEILATLRSAYRLAQGEAFRLWHSENTSVFEEAFKDLDDKTANNIRVVFGEMNPQTDKDSFLYTNQFQKKALEILQEISNLNPEETQPKASLMNLKKALTTAIEYIGNGDILDDRYLGISYREMKNKFVVGHESPFQVHQLSANPEADPDNYVVANSPGPDYSQRPVKIGFVPNNKKENNEFLSYAVFGFHQVDSSRPRPQTVDDYYFRHDIQSFRKANLAFRKFIGGIPLLSEGSNLDLYVLQKGQKLDSTYNLIYDISINEGEIDWEGKTMSVLDNQGKIKVTKPSHLFVDRQSDATGQISVDSFEAIIVTPRNIQGTLLITGPIDQVKMSHYKLPDELDNISSLVVNNKLDGIAVTRAGGAITSRGIVFIAENDFGAKVKVIFSLKDVPNENGGLSKALVMTEIESKKIPTKEWAELKEKPTIRNRIVNGQTQPTIDIVSGEVHFTGTDNRKIGFNYDVLILEDDTDTSICTNFGSCTFKDRATGAFWNNTSTIRMTGSSLLTVISNEKGINLEGSSAVFMCFMKEGSRKDNVWVNLGDENARIITPSNFEKPLFSDISVASSIKTNSQLVIDNAHFSLPFDLNTIGKLIAGQSVDKDTVVSHGGEMLSDKSFRIQAKNKNGDTILVHLELRDVPNTADDPVRMLVMVKVEDVAGEAQNTVAIPPQSLELSTASPAPPATVAPLVIDTETIATVTTIETLAPFAHLESGSRQFNGYINSMDANKDTYFSAIRDHSPDAKVASSKEAYRTSQHASIRDWVSKNATHIHESFDSLDAPLKNSLTTQLNALIATVDKPQPTSEYLPTHTQAIALLQALRDLPQEVVEANPQIAVAKNGLIGQIESISNGSILDISDFKDKTVQDVLQAVRKVQDGKDTGIISADQVLDGLTTDLIKHPTGYKITRQKESQIGFIPKIGAETELTTKAKIETNTMHARSRVEILDIGNFPISFADKEQGNYSKTLVGEKGSLQVRGRTNLAIGANGVGMRADDDANIFISRNALALGSVTLSGSSMETVMYDTATHRLQDSSVAYIDESSKSLKSKIHIGKNATLITPDYFSGVPMLLDTSGDDKAKIPLRHFRLPTGLNSVKDLVSAGGSLEIAEIQKYNGKVSSDNKSVSLTARDSEDRKISVTFELRQVPNESGQLVSGLVMTKVVEVASTVSAPAPTPSALVGQNNPTEPPQNSRPAKPVRNAPVEITAPVESLKLVVSSAFGFREPLLKSDGEKSQDRYILSGSWGGVIDGAGGQERGDIAAQALQEVLQSVAEGKDHIFTHNGDTHTIRANRLDFEGKNSTDNENELLFLATHLNTRLQKVNESQSVKSMAAIAIGKIYLDQNKERTFTYLNHGDCEIAIVKKNGTVELLHNSSVRIGAEKEDNGIENYLKEREASRRLLTGSGNNEFLKSVKWSYGSIGLDQGDRVVFMTDGIAEDLQNIRGTISNDGNQVSAVKGTDGNMIGMDILGKIDPNTPIGDVPKAIFSLLDSVRKDAIEGGIRIVRKSDVYNKIVIRRVVKRPSNQPGINLNIIVGGKISDSPGVAGDDGETVVVMEANLVADVPKKAHVAPIPASAEATITAPETVHDKDALAQFSSDVIRQVRIMSEKPNLIGEIKRKAGALVAYDDPNFIPYLDEILISKNLTDSDGQRALSVARGFLNLETPPGMRRELTIKKNFGSPILEIFVPRTDFESPPTHKFSVQFTGLLQRLLADDESKPNRPRWIVDASGRFDFQGDYIARVVSDSGRLRNLRAKELRVGNKDGDFEQIYLYDSSIEWVKISAGKQLVIQSSDIVLGNGGLMGSLDIGSRSSVIVNVDEVNISKKITMYNTRESSLVLLADYQNRISDEDAKSIAKNPLAIVMKTGNGISNIELEAEFKRTQTNLTPKNASSEMKGTAPKRININGKNYVIVPVQRLTENGIEKQTGYAILSFNPIKRSSSTDPIESQTTNMLRVVGFWDGKSEAPVQIEGKTVQFKPYRGIRNLWGLTN